MKAILGSKVLEDPEKLRRRILHPLERQGFVTRGDAVGPPEDADKDALRRMHAEAVRRRIEKARPGLARFEAKLLACFACGYEVVPRCIQPRLVEVWPNTEDELLFWFPRPRLHRIRFHGVLAPNAKLRSAIVSSPPANATKPIRPR